MPRPGEDFQKLVAYLERVISNAPNVTLESPKLIPDKVTGNLREHDIVITHRLPHRELTTAIECRDLSRQVTVDQVEAFNTKCQDTGIDKRVIVSSRGFYKTTLKKAKRYGIDCLTLAQVKNVDWLGEVDIIFRYDHIRHTEIRFGVPSAFLGRTGSLYHSASGGPDEEMGIRSIAGGDELSFEDNAKSKLLDLIIDKLPYVARQLSGVWPVTINDPEVFYFLDDDGVRHNLMGMQLEIFWDAQESQSPLTFHHYGAEGEKPTFEIATTDVQPIGKYHQGRAMFIADEERHVRMTVTIGPTESVT